MCDQELLDGDGAGRAALLPLSARAIIVTMRDCRTKPLGPERNHVMATAMSTTVQALIHKIERLPPQRLAEVEDFVDFLHAREDDKRLTQAAAKAGEASFAAAWDNDENAVYDRM
jgi:hypothetical protein